MARLSSRAALVAAIVFSSLLLAGCGRNGLGEARTACRIAKQGITLIHRAEKPGVSPSESAHLLRQARSLFVHAEGYAARATSSDGRWNALMTSLNLTRRVPVTNMVPTLTNQCRSIMSDNYLY